MFAAGLVSFVRNTLLPAAATKWASLLSVRGVNGPLFASRSCEGYWPNPNGVGPNLCARYSSNPPTCANMGDDIPITFDSSLLGPDPYWPNVGMSSSLAMPKYVIILSIIIPFLIICFTFDIVTEVFDSPLLRRQCGTKKLVPSSTLHLISCSLRNSPFSFS